VRKERWVAIFRPVCDTTGSLDNTVVVLDHAQLIDRIGLLEGLNINPSVCKGVLAAWPPQ
jgi:hypothetical protein